MSSDNNQIRIRIRESNVSGTIELRIPNSYIFLYNLFNYFHQLIETDYESHLINESLNSVKAFEKTNLKISTSLHEYNHESYLNNECVICKDEFVLKQEVAMINCNHIFHKKCIDEWGSFKNECPICRTNITLHNSDL